MSVIYLVHFSLLLKPPWDLKSCILVRFCVQVDTAGWLERTKQDKGPASLSIMQSRKNLMRAHVVALVLDAEEVHNILHCLFIMPQNLFSELRVYAYNANLVSFWSSLLHKYFIVSWKKWFLVAPSILACWCFLGVEIFDRNWKSLQNFVSYQLDHWLYS